MNGAAFERPLTMFVGLGFPRHIDNATDALQALDELAPLEHGPAHNVAVRACRAALLGEIEPETARGIVEGYARARGVLVEELLAPHTVAARGDLVGPDPERGQGHPRRWAGHAGLHRPAPEAVDANRAG